MVSSSDKGLTKRERQEIARLEAREKWAQERRRRVRRRWFTQGAVVVVMLAVVALVAGNMISQARAASIGPANMASDGIVLTGDGSTITASTTAAVPAGGSPTATDESTVRASGVVTIDLYVDYFCPHCGTFESTNMTQLKEWVTAGYATLEIHPVAILDSASLGTSYSSRAANAAACVANDDPDHFLAVHEALFAQQPQENTAGLDDDALRALVSGAGVTDDSVFACITGGEFRTWVSDATERATSGPLASTDIALSSTPTVLVNGQQYTGANDDADAFLQFISATLEAEESTPTPTPTPAG
ncbi:thioredoxin domain-containing protein [Microbacteriaceae bacterium VKM Ac-2854]|nr:thioredoxin domain-containing protein [Microbacteriaceae bacterium VKM Ac-2854]